MRWATAAAVAADLTHGELGVQSGHKVDGSRRVVSADATLSALVVNDGRSDLTLSPFFAPGTTAYTALVANAVAQVAVTTTTTHAEATIEYLNASDMTLDDPDISDTVQPVTLEEGDNVVKVKVTAEDGATTKTYTVTVTRRAPGVEGELRLTDEEPYTHPDGHEGVEGRVEIFHAESWGTVCDDGFSRETTSRFIVELDANGNATANVTESESANDAPALVCQAMGYDNGEYASGYGQSGESQPSGPGITIYYSADDRYPPNGPLPIWVDDMTCAAGDAAQRVDALPAPLAHCGYAGWGLHNCTHREDAGVRCWNELESAQAGARALKARFVSPPEHHDGSGRVKVRVAFSEAIDESPETVGEHGVKVEGGRVTTVRRVDNQPGGGAARRSGGGQEDGQEDGERVWEFEIEPGSDDDLTMRIDAGRPCDEPGAICTADGRSLSEGIATTVEGPDPVPLTAELQGLPEAHARPGQVGADERSRPRLLAPGRPGAAAAHRRDRHRPVLVRVDLPDPRGPAGGAAPRGRLVPAPHDPGTRDQPLRHPARLPCAAAGRACLPDEPAEPDGDAGGRRRRAGRHARAARAVAHRRLCDAVRQAAGRRAPRLYARARRRGRRRDRGGRPAPALRSIAAGIAAHYVPGTPLYGRPLPDIDALLARQDLAGSYARVLDDALTHAASEERETLARVVAEDAREASWMAAASFFNTIAHRVGLFQAAAHNVPAVALPVPSLDEWSPAADAAVKGVAAQLARSRQYHPMLLSAANAGAGALPAAGGGGGGMVSGLLEFIDLDSVIVADSGNPIADLAALGHGLLNAALAAIAALMGAATGSGLLESIPFIGKGLDVFESAWQVSDALVSTLLGLLIIAGAVLAYVLPAIPFIRFLFGILGWILNVAIAVLAVTVFAAAHVTREDGNRLTTQATRQGWLFLPALVLRPALMLLGLILGYFVFLAGIGLFNQVWLPQMRDAGASGALGPVGFLAMLALYVIVAYGLMNASFKLIDLLPSAVLDWIGGRAGAGDDGSERTAGAAVGGISRLGAVRIGARTRRGGAGS